MLLSIHIAAGGLAIVLGTVALLVKKGGTIHRRSGLLFVYSMLVLGATAALLGQGNRMKNGGLAGEPKKLFSGPEGVKYLSA